MVTQNTDSPAETAAPSSATSSGSTSVTSGFSHTDYAIVICAVVGGITIGLGLLAWNRGWFRAKPKNGGAGGSGTNGARKKNGNEEGGE